MRYLLFFLFLILYSHFGFAQTPQCTGLVGSPNVCGFTPAQAGGLLSERTSSCTNAGNKLISNGVCGQNTHGRGTPTYLCYLACTCPPPQVLTRVLINGTYEDKCLEEGDETPPDDLCPSGKPKVDGQCPVCIGEQNEDGTCVDDVGGSSAANSSANNSTPASSPDTGSSGSAASNGGGDDGGGDNGGGGGGDNGGGGNNGGGGSASAAASSSGSNSSWTPIAGYGNWIPVNANSTCPNKFQDQSGQWWYSGGNSGSFGSAASAMPISGDCDYTSKTYFSCITSQKLSDSGSGANSSWTPVAGYGNWIPVDENSNCPNKFKDASGNWWCSGGGSGGGGGGSGTASSGGAAGSSGASAAGECDPTARDYLDCVSSGKTSSRGSASSASSVTSAASSSTRSGAFSSLGEKGEFDGEAVEKKHEELVEELENKIADIKADIQGEFGGTISGSGTIQDFCKNIRNSEVCFGLKKWEPFLDPICAAIFLVACVMAFSIVLRG